MRKNQENLQKLSFISKSRLDDLKFFVLINRKMRRLSNFFGSNFEKDSSKNAHSFEFFFCVEKVSRSTTCHITEMMKYFSGDNQYFGLKFVILKHDCFRQFLANICWIQCWNLLRTFQNYSWEQDLDGKSCHSWWDFANCVHVEYMIATREAWTFSNFFNLLWIYL